MKILYPYDVLTGEVRLTVDKVTIDGKRLSTAHIDPDHQEVHFGELDSAWEDATLVLTVTAPTVSTDNTGSWTNLQAVVQVMCHHTNSRHAVVLKPDPYSPGRWTGAVDLDRSTWYGRVTIAALVPATVDGVPHRVIGSSDPWTISFDDLPRSPVHGSINVQWSDFANDVERPYLKAYKDHEYFVRLDPDDPSLYLNSGFEGLEGLLVDRKHRPAAEKALHDATRGRYAKDVWQSLFISALSTVERDPDTKLPEWPGDGWRKVVLQTLLPDMYPDLAPDDALVAAVEARDGDGVGDLLERLLPAADAHVRLPQLIRGGIRGLEDDKDKDRREAQL